MSFTTYLKFSIFYSSDTLIQTACYEISVTSTENSVLYNIGLSRGTNVKIGKIQFL